MSPATTASVVLEFMPTMQNFGASPGMTWNPTCSGFVGLAMTSSTASGRTVLDFPGMVIYSHDMEALLLIAVVTGVLR